MKKEVEEVEEEEGESGLECGGGKSTQVFLLGCQKVSQEIQHILEEPLLALQARCVSLERKVQQLFAYSAAAVPHVLD